MTDLSIYVRRLGRLKIRETALEIMQCKASSFRLYWLVSKLDNETDM